MTVLTIGMAHFEDYDGAYFTIQSCRLHQKVKGEIEFVVVDNSPNTPQGRSLAELIGHVGGKYVPLTETVGTSAPRDRVFREATGKYVVCLDSHVLLIPGALQSLVDYHDSRPDNRDIVSGPMLADNSGLYATHFNDVWRAEMWGVWGLAWGCGCKRKNSLQFATIEGERGTLSYRELVGQKPVTKCEACGRDLPVLSWPAHEHALDKEGYVCLATKPDPFEIPGMGLGCFSMRREAWVGFNPNARGFGGEELYVHAKVRAAGGKAICLPTLAWMHRFGRPGGVKYKLTREDKVRNYVLEFQEMGWDLSPVKEHFVDGKMLSVAAWDRLVADPLSTAPVAAEPACGTCGGGGAQPPAGDHNLDSLFDWCKGVPRDLNQHADKIREIAGQVKHVTAITKRREWDVFLLAGRPDFLVSYCKEKDPIRDKLDAVLVATEVNPRAPRRVKSFTKGTVDSLELDKIDETELLVIDTVHHADRLYQELTRFAPSVRRWILIRGTGAFGEVAEGGGPGLLPALRRYLRENPQWSVIYHAMHQYGMTLISCDPADRPKLPGVITMAANLARSLAAHVADGAGKVTAETLQARLEVCTLCEQRSEDRCSACGCFLSVKAGWRTSECPLGRWPALLDDGGTNTTPPPQPRECVIACLIAGGSGDCGNGETPTRLEIEIAAKERPILLELLK